MRALYLAQAVEGGLTFWSSAQRTDELIAVFALLQNEGVGLIVWQRFGQMARDRKLPIRSVAGTVFVRHQKMREPAFAFREEALHQKPDRVAAALGLRDHGDAARRQTVIVVAIIVALETPRAGVRRRRHRLSLRVRWRRQTRRGS